MVENSIVGFQSSVLHEDVVGVFKTSVKSDKIFFSQRIAKKPLFVRRQSFLCFTTRITNNNNNNNNTVVHSRARS